MIRFIAPGDARLADIVADLATRGLRLVCRPAGLFVVVRR